MTKRSTSSEAAAYRRNAGRITGREVLHPHDKRARIAALPALRRRRERRNLEEAWQSEEGRAAQEAGEALGGLRRAAEELGSSLDELGALHLSTLLGKVEAEQLRVRSARAHLETAEEALGHGDFGAAGVAAEKAAWELWQVGGPLVVALNEALGKAAVSKPQRSRLEENLAERRQAKTQLEGARASQGPGALSVAGRLHELDAAGFRLAAEILKGQVRRAASPRRRGAVGRQGDVPIQSPQECESFADVGGLDDVKEQLRSTIGAILERPQDAARYHVVHNGILFHGPPGTGKNLLSRAIAGEYGLAYIRFSPASIASSFIHEAAANLRTLFELAVSNVPCVLFLDEIDAIAADRGDQPSADHREVVTQLMICLEEYRSVPGLVIAAATNDLDRLDPGLREGRFDAKIYVPLPDPQARQDVLRVHLGRRGSAVAGEVDLAELSRLTAGYSSAALETVVSLAAQGALGKRTPIRHADLVTAIRERGGRERVSLEERVSWEDVVLADETRERLLEILNAFTHPELARDLGVKTPPGVLLHGPPGTGKTTVAKALASEVSASFYEQSAANLLSKWAGESEQRVAKLFARARANRPAIIFIDEIDTLLRRRRAAASSWEERVVSQFLRELDGLRGGEQVLLVGATSRVDVVDEAIVGRRLTPIELGLPDPAMRVQLIRLLCRDVKLAPDVNLRALATATEGMSGADLRRIRDEAGMKALSRTTRSRSPAERRKAAIGMADFRAALDAQRGRTSLAQV